MSKSSLLRMGVSALSLLIGSGAASHAADTAIPSSSNTYTIGDSGSYVVNAGTNAGGGTADQAIFNTGTGGTLTVDGTVSAATMGVYIAGGGLLALTNNSTGTISGGTVGVRVVSGTYITTLTNSGTFAGGAGISNGGTITTLTNSGTIAAGSGIGNGGTITTLTNSGTIASTGDYGISSAGTITTLTNSGTISSAAFGIYNNQTITTLTNSGTIRGDSDGVYNGRTITTLTNSGTIRGDVYGVYNGRTITTLTNIGTISSLSVGIKPDILNFGTITTLTNGQSGLTYRGNLPGTYNTYFKTASTYGSVDFSGLSGTSLTYGLAKASGVAYAVGKYTNVVSADVDSGLSFTTLTVSGVTYSLVLHDDITGDYKCPTTACYDLLISAVSNPGTWRSVGLTAGGNSTSLGAVLDQISANGRLSGPLNILSTLPDAEQGRALRQLSAAPVATSVVSSGATTTPSNIAIDSHLNATVADASGNRGAAAGDAFQQGFLWGQVLGNHASLRGSSSGDGFSSNAFGFLVGADTFVTDNSAAGLAFNWIRNSARGKGGASGNATTTDTYQVSLYGSWRPGGQAAWVQGLVAGGVNQYDQKRNIDFLGQTASATYLGLQAQAKVTAGWDFALDDGLTVSPLGSLQVIRVQNQAYTETGSSVNQSVARQGFNTVESVIGGRLSRNFDTELGKLTADAQAGWLHDYLHDAISSVASLAGTGYVVNTARLPSNGAQIGLGASLQESDDLSIRAEYQGDLRDGYASHTGLLKVRSSF